jgi:hypothetical protein
MYRDKKRSYEYELDFWSILGHFRGVKNGQKAPKIFFRNLHEESFNFIYNNNTYQSHLKK